MRSVAMPTSGQGSRTVPRTYREYSLLAKLQFPTVQDVQSEEIHFNDTGSVPYAGVSA